MTAPFDPYHRWLGIRPEEQPADHYRLLGLARFEDDVEVIRDAAERQIAHVRRYAAGEHAEDATRILNELGNAKASLIVANRKVAYDASLNGAAVATPHANHRADALQIAPIPLELVEPDFEAGAAASEVDRPPQLASRPDTPARPAALALVSRQPKTLAQMQSLQRKPSTVPSGRPLVRQADDFLKRLAGDGNDLLHGFLRICAIAEAIVVPVACVLLAVSWMSPWNQSAIATAAIPSESTVPLPLALAPIAVENVPIPSQTPATPPLASAPIDNLQVNEGTKLRITNSIEMQLVLIPAGEFLMGSPKTEAGRQNDEQQHRVRLTRPFYLATTEVTQGQWEAVMGTTPWKRQSFVKEGSDYPATYVSWEDAIDFCRRLSARESSTYRLPTEAEWEYACRAGSTTAYSFGDSPASMKDYAWFHENAWDMAEKYAHRVGQKLPNQWGLYDMMGNVWEWACKEHCVSRGN